MATPILLCEMGQLFKLDPQLEPNEQEWRMIYTSPRLQQWLMNDLGNLESTWNVEVTPAQQLDALTEEFCSGCTLDYGIQFHPIQHVQGGIWMLKTQDLRIFGWFYVKDCFIGWRAEIADYVKANNLYYGLAGETARFRDRLDLDLPKFIPGEDPNDVISNYA